MAFVGRWVTSGCSLEELQSLSSRFTAAAAPLGSRLTCRGHVSAARQGSVTIAYTATIDATDVVAITGTAVVDLTVVERLEGRENHPHRADSSSSEGAAARCDS